MPNDDRLFPGRMDTQIGGGPTSDDEWAVDKIKSHAGSGEESIFEILWKSGDVTWMPLYQIRHLQALEIYLELMGTLPNDGNVSATWNVKPGQGICPSGKDVDPIFSQWSNPANISMSPGQHFDDIWL